MHGDAVARIIATLCLLAAAIALPAQAAQPAARSCKVLTYTIARTYQGMGPGRIQVTYRVFFASNGAVQMYSLLHSSHNQEVDHTALLQLQKKYGLEMVNAPPLRITKYRKKSADLSVPYAAQDSCGRTTYFH